VLFGLGGPGLLSDYWVFVVTFGLLTGIAGLGLVVVTGWSGQMSLAQAAFMGIGAATFGHVSGRSGSLFGQQGVPAGSASTAKVVLMFSQQPMVVGLLASVLVAAAFGLLVGIPALRARGLHLAIATLGFALVVEFMVFRWTPLGGGYEGFQYGQAGSRSQTGLYYLAFGSAAVVALILTWMRHKSRFGLRLIATRDSELAVEGMGVSAVRYRLAAFAISAGLGGYAGALYVMLLRDVRMESFGSLQSIVLYAAISIGGIAAPAGAIIGGLVYSVLPEQLRSLGHETWSSMVFGGGLLAVSLLLPRGLIHLPSALRSTLRRGAVAPRRQAVTPPRTAIAVRRPPRTVRRESAVVSAGATGRKP
jgi:branched-chain amino acid transport system permease protein